MPDAPELQALIVQLRHPPQILECASPQQGCKEEDKSLGTGLPPLGECINIIFGGDSGFISKRAQKFSLPEIMPIELAI
jgi:hypothetical protein